MLAVMMGVVVAGSAFGADFTRYQVILDRKPFGEEAVVLPAQNVGPDGKPMPPPESFVKNLKMCAVTRHALTGRLQVGLVDSATKKNYFLNVGDSEDGITLVDADYDGEKALLRKGAEEVWLGMSDVTSMATGPAVLPVPSGAGRAAQPPGMTMPQPSAVPAPPPMPSRPDRGVRRRDLSAVVTNRPSGEVLAKHLEQYQMDLIRAGGTKGPPLPIPLTPEMDQQLVKEGVLPAQ